MAYDIFYIVIWHKDVYTYLERSVPLEAGREVVYIMYLNMGHM